MLELAGNRGEVVKLPLELNARRRDELLRFAEYCTVRIERVLDGIDRWEVSVARNANAANATVRAHRRGAMIEARANASDLAGAIWNAMCRAEQRLFEAARSSE